MIMAYINNYLPGKKRESELRITAGGKTKCIHNSPKQREVRLSVGRNFCVCVCVFCIWRRQTSCISNLSLLEC